MTFDFQNQNRRLRSSIRELTKNIQKSDEVAENSEKLEGNTLEQILETIRGGLEKTLDDVWTRLIGHEDNTNNPHDVTAEQLNLENVDNYATADQTQAEQGESNSLFMTPRRVKDAIVKQVLNGLNEHKNDTTNPHSVTKAQVGLDNIPNGISSSRDLDSIDKLLTARGMHRHKRSSDHDDRYYRQAEVDTGFDQLENNLINYTDEQTLRAVNGLIRTNPAIAQSSTQAETLKGQSQSFAEVFNSWRRFSHAVGDPNQPVDSTELDSWQYNSTDDSIESTINSSTHIGFVSPEGYEDYVFEVRLNSSDTSDDDMIGVCLGFEVVDGVEHALIATRSLKEPAFKIRDLFSDTIIAETSAGLTSHAENGGGDGWGSYANGCKLKVTRSGNSFTVETTDVDSETYVSEATLTFSLDDLDVLSKYKGPSPYGFVARSQPNATWNTIIRPIAVDTVLDVENGTKWEWDGQSWSSTTLSDGDIPEKRLFHNKDQDIAYMSDREGDLRHVVLSDEITKIVRVSEANYPSNPDPTVLYVVTE